MGQLRTLVLFLVYKLEICHFDMWRLFKQGMKVTIIWESKNICQWVGIDKNNGLVFYRQKIVHLVMWPLVPCHQPISYPIWPFDDQVEEPQVSDSQRWSWPYLHPFFNSFYLGKCHENIIFSVVADLYPIWAMLNWSPELNYQCCRVDNFIVFLIKAFILHLSCLECL